MEEEINRYKTIIGAYYGVMLMDEYLLKAYTLTHIAALEENYIQGKNLPTAELKTYVRNKVPMKVKLQDALYILNELDEDKELLHLIKKKIRKIDSEEN